MSDKILYRVALEYEVAETFAEQVEPNYVDGVDINSFADDRFLIAEPDMVVFLIRRVAALSHAAQNKGQVTSRRLPVRAFERPEE